MRNQPGAYWWLESPFLDLISLYSNAAEDFGILGADEHDSHQQEWLLKSLKSIADNRQNGTRNALIIAAHQPSSRACWCHDYPGHVRSDPLRPSKRIETVAIDLGSGQKTIPTFD
jgi:hypothetical protein